MRKFWRRLGQWVLGLVGLGIVGLLATLTTVDETASTGRGYATSTRARLDALEVAPGSVPVVGELRAGFGRAKLTPTLGAAGDVPERGEFRSLPLAGYGNRKGQPATGVHDDLWVKAMAFEVGGRTGVVVAADALIIPREVSEAAVERLRERYGLRREQVYFGATHTHCSLGGWGEGWVGEAFAGGFQPSVRVWFAQQLAAAAGAAVADLAPASVGRAAFAAPDLTRNRLVGDGGTIDPEFALLVVQKRGGERGVIGSFAAHATVLSGAMMEFSAEYPGVWQRTMEQAGTGMALFLAGGVGSHAPKPPGSGLAGMQRLGELLAERSAKALGEAVLTNRVTFQFATLDVDLPELQARLTDGVRLRPWVAARLLPVRSRTWLQVLRLGDAVWLSTPCDYSGELALRLKASGRAGQRSVAVTSFNGDYVGYVVPAEYYHRDGYETRTMAFFGPQLPDYFDALLHGLLGLTLEGAYPETSPALREGGALTKLVARR